MKRLFASLIVALFAAQLALAHDPRTVAKNLSHTLSIEGAGKLTLSYKSLHYNEQGFSQRKTERAMTTFNRLWKSIGKLDSDFDITLGTVRGGVITRTSKTITGAINGGGIDVELRTLNGNVYLRKGR